jgi:hypothetical protein
MMLTIVWYRIFYMLRARSYPAAAAASLEHAALASRRYDSTGSRAACICTDGRFYAAEEVANAHKK